MATALSPSPRVSSRGGVEYRYDNGNSYYYKNSDGKEAQHAFSSKSKVLSSIRALISRRSLLLLSPTNFITYRQHLLQEHGHERRQVDSSSSFRPGQEVSTSFDDDGGGDPLLFSREGKTE